MKADRYPELLELLPYLGKWLLLAGAVAVLAGSASAFFLFALEWATSTRIEHRWLIGLLPLAGFFVGWLYLRFGQQVEAGNNLLIDEIHDPRKVIPLRMVPLVLGGTVISHLFGASVGREGTAVQMGGALADQITRVFRLKPEDRRIILMAGISVGFASRPLRHPVDSGLAAGRDGDRGGDLRPQRHLPRPACRPRQAPPRAGRHAARGTARLPEGPAR